MPDARPALIISRDVSRDRLSAIEFGRSGFGLELDRWRFITDEVAWLLDEPGGRIVVVQAFGGSELDLDSAEFAELWDPANGRFDAPTLGVIDVVAGAVLVAALSMYEFESTPDRDPEQLRHEAEILGIDAEQREPIEMWLALLSTGDLRAHLGLGIEFCARGNHRVAYGHFRFHVSVSPASTSTWRWLGITALAIGEEAEAREAWATAIDLEARGFGESDAATLLEALDEHADAREDRPMPSHQHRSAFEGVLAKSAELCAIDLQAYGDVVRTHRVVESRNLRFPFTLALANAARAAELDLSLDQEQPHSLRDDQFEGAGSVDLRCRVGSSVFDIELKAGEGKSALYQCAWDALKLATLVSSGGCDAAYLVAAVPSADLAHSEDHTSSGLELFTDGVHVAADLRDRYASSFGGYEKERASRPGPRTVPATFETARIANEPITFAHAEELGFPHHTEWRLLVARIEASGETYEWGRLTA